MKELNQWDRSLINSCVKVWRVFVVVVVGLLRIFISSFGLWQRSDCFTVKNVIVDVSKFVCKLPFVVQYLFVLVAA